MRYVPFNVNQGRASFPKYHIASIVGASGTCEIRCHHCRGQQNDIVVRTCSYGYVNAVVKVDCSTAQGFGCGQAIVATTWCSALPSFETMQLDPASAVTVSNLRGALRHRLLAAKVISQWQSVNLVAVRGGGHQILHGNRRVWNPSWVHRAVQKKKLKPKRRVTRKTSNLQLLAENYLRKV